MYWRRLASTFALLLALPPVVTASPATVGLAAHCAAARFPWVFARLLPEIRLSAPVQQTGSASCRYSRRAGATGLEPTLHPRDPLGENARVPAYTVNEDAVRHAKQLIGARQYVLRSTIDVPDRWLPHLCLVRQEPPE
jgi:hypothetical protein